MGSYHSAFLAYSLGCHGRLSRTALLQMGTDQHFFYYLLFRPTALKLFDDPDLGGAVSLGDPLLLPAAHESGGPTSSPEHGDASKKLFRYCCLQEGFSSSCPRARVFYQLQPMREEGPRPG